MVLYFILSLQRDIRDRVSQLELLCFGAIWIGKSVACFFIADISEKAWFLFFQYHLFFTVLFMRDSLPVVVRVRQSGIARSGRFVKGKEVLIWFFLIYCLCFNIFYKSWGFMLSVLISVLDLLGKLLRLVER